MDKRQQILDRLQKENPHSIPVLKAMDEWAMQQCKAFAEWLDEKATQLEKGIWTHCITNPNTPMTTEELYLHFLLTQSKQQ